MWRTAQDTYLEERILSADPLELIDLLYQGAITAVNEARRHLAEGRIQARARSISKACDILAELHTSLNFERGGAVSQQLAELYGYMHRRLIEANFRQSVEPLNEVSGLLSTLQEGWAAARTQGIPAAAGESPWIPALALEPELAQASGNWSF